MTRGWSASRPALGTRATCCTWRSSCRWTGWWWKWLGWRNSNGAATRWTGGQATSWSPSPPNLIPWPMPGWSEHAKLRLTRDQGTF
ncbi:hypothetical protein ACFPRL_01110 [Pseudoclavibacter helvolus]